MYLFNVVNAIQTKDVGILFKKWFSIPISNYVYFITNMSYNDIGGESTSTMLCCVHRYTCAYMHKHEMYTHLWIIVCRVPPTLSFTFT